MRAPRHLRFSSHRLFGRPGSSRRRNSRRPEAACERLEDRTLLAATVGIYDENVENPNTVDFVATGSSFTNAEFAEDVAAAFAQNAGGVINRYIAGYYEFGADASKTLRFFPADGTNWAGGAAYGISGGGSFASSSLGGFAFTSFDFDGVTTAGTDGAPLDEHVVAFGVTVCSITTVDGVDRDYGDVTVTGRLASGGTMLAMRHIGEATGAGDTFYGLAAPEGDHFVGFSLRYDGSTNERDNRLWFDDIGFITSAFVADPPPPAASLTLSISPNSVSEPDGTATGTVTRDGDLTDALVVRLASSDTSEATVPETVTIAAGEASATFTIDAVDDAILDGLQQVTITATAGGAGSITRDTSFGSGGVAATSLDMNIQPPNAAVAVQANGKIVAAGEDPHTGSWRITRLNSDGSLDTSFGAGGATTTQFSANAIYPVPHTVVVQADGKILVGGKISAGTGTAVLARYNADGTLDASFGNGGIADLANAGGWIEDIAVGTDGRIMLAIRMNGTVYFRAARLNADGRFDPTFGVRTYNTINASAKSVSLLDDGGFLLAGGDTVARFDAAGNLDASFGDGGVRRINFGTTFTDVIDSVVLADGRIALGIYVSVGGTGGADFAAARLNADGSLDTSFGGDGLARTDFSGTSDLPTSMAVQSDGKIILGGYTVVGDSIHDVALVRYGTDGELDPTFDGDGRFTDSLVAYNPERIFDVALQQDGKLVALGGWGDDYRVARYEPGGTPLTAEATLTVEDDEVNSAVVDTLVDEDDGDYSAGDLSLREATKIVAAGGTIGFASALSGGTITLTGGHIALDRDMTVAGLGASQLAIDGNDLSRIFFVTAGTTVELSGLTLTGGGGNAAYGGAIYNLGTLTVADSVIVGNRAYYFGGGIDSRGALTLTNSVVADNVAGTQGGGIYNHFDAVLTIADSSVAGNSTGAFGGGIWTNGTATISGSTISGNHAGSIGGGILSFISLTILDSTVSNNATDAQGDGGGIDNRGTLFAANVTISGNSAGDFGGGIRTDGDVTLRNVTIFGNRADTDGNAFGGGGGISIYTDATVTLHNTVVAGNVRETGDGAPNDISGGGLAAGSHNLIGDAGSAGGLRGILIDGVDGNIVGIDWGTVLDPVLKDNGGATFTHALLRDGAATDVGDDAQALGPDGNPLTADQRGFLRFVGTVDIGAYELSNSLPTASDDAFATLASQILTGDLFADNGAGLDSDPDGDPLTVTAVNGSSTVVGAAFTLASGALLRVNADGTFSYDSNGAFDSLAEGDTRLDRFLYTIGDGHDGTDTATVTITVTGVNDPPSLADAAFSVPENSPAGTPVGTVSASDPDGTAAVYSITSGNSDGAFAIDPTTGAVTVADGSKLDYETAPVRTLTVRASDGTLSDEAVVTIGITNVDEIIRPVIDVQPGDPSNRISLKGNGKISVAILSSDTFDARTVVIDSLRFGRTGTENSLSRHRGQPRYQVTDVNGDGRLDLLVTFEVRAAGFQQGDTEAILTGRTVDGDAIESRDAISTGENSNKGKTRKKSARKATRTLENAFVFSGLADEESFWLGLFRG